MEASALSRLLSQPEGQRRLGPFLIDEGRKLGQGGFAPVYLAEEMHADVVLRTVALKIFSLGETPTETPSRPSSTGASRKAQIVEEARALCRVEHPNVVRFYALPTDDDLGLMGLAMEYIAGTSLEERLRGGPVSVAETLRVGESVASALAAVHAVGLVHRDIKPANIVDAQGVYKLIDFGIAAADGARTRAVSKPKTPVLAGDFMIDGSTTFATSSSTSTGAGIAGTIGYIDPVCLQKGAPASASSDLYALGATLFECLSGKLPAVAASTQPDVDAASKAEVFQQVLYGHTPAPSVGSLRDDVPKALIELVGSLLNADPKDRPRSAEAVVHTLARVRAETRGRARALPPEDVGPFRGLARFEEDDEEIFFGRSADIAGSLELLRARGFVTLVGASGSGKSSLARAGVAPAICRGGLGGWPSRWRRLVVTPGRDPYETWAAALKDLDPALAGKGLAELTASLEAYPERTGEGLLLLVDQLEELVTLSETHSRDQAVELLVRLGERSTPGLRILTAARRDLLDDLLALPHHFGRLLSRGVVLVAPLSDVVWEDVLAQSLSVYGYRFEDEELREAVIEQLHGTIGAMPLVQFALTQLWSQRDTKRKLITRDGLEAIGGIGGALERHAEATYAELVAADLEDPSRGLLLSLTTPQGTRSKRSKAGIVRGPGAARVLGALTDARLVIEEPDGFTLAHEALLSQWRRMREWVEALRSDRQLAEELERAAGAWRQTGDDTLLWRRRRLAGAEEVRRADLIDVSEAADAFVRASRSAARRSRVWLGAVAGAVVALCIAGVVAYMSRVQQQQAKTRVEQQKTVEALREANVQKEEANHQKEEAQVREQEANAAKSDAEGARNTAEVAKTKARDAEKAELQAKTDFADRLADLEGRLKKASTKAEYDALKKDVTYGATTSTPTANPVDTRRVLDDPAGTKKTLQSKSPDQLDCRQAKMLMGLCASDGDVSCRDRARKRITEACAGQ